MNSPEETKERTRTSFLGRLRSERLSGRDAADYSAEFVPLLISGGLGALSLFGTTYFYEYYRGFGISIFEVDFEFLEATVIGFRLMIDDWAIFKIIPAAGMVALVVVTARRVSGSVGLYIASASMLLLFFWFVVCVAIGDARTDTTRVTSGKAGRIAYCELRDDARFPEDFAKRFEALTTQDRIRKILETSTSIYLSASVDTQKRGFRGQTYVINKSDISYCRVIGN